MDHAQALKIRTDMQRQMGQKAEAMRREALDEVLRYEGALGCLTQIDQALARSCDGVKAAVDGKGDAEPLSLEAGQERLQGLKAAQAVAAEMRTTALSHMASLKGRVAQSERTLDMLEGLFTADLQAAQALVDHPPEAPASHSGKHPGPSLAAQRQAGALSSEPI